MPASTLDAPWPGIAWDDPWYQPWRDLGEPAYARVAQGQAVWQALAAGPSSPVGFVSQQSLPEGVAYERFIFEARQVPTREGLHDFFNGLSWQAFPLTKLRLNALQAAEIARDGVGAVRGPVRDAITVFDENGALLQAPPALWEALRARQWQRLFVTLRPLWRQASLLVFGHALLEKLVSPRKDMTAHVWCANAPLGIAPASGQMSSHMTGRQAADAWLAQACSAEALQAKPFTPLPLLGLPGWWSANEDPAFYRDDRVFRPHRGGDPRASADAGPGAQPVSTVPQAVPGAKSSS